ncbi:Uncharacterized protein dnm_057790 [Desulfonema magnum]|uniref:Uncharacterized protein n=1 Tax=Desulfonema magnum TaxID=45655 RepID=A0A975BQA9_9BACT|nr:Uncharacterized protein dnm_057790 [Desulfonema magnum]
MRGPNNLYLSHGFSALRIRFHKLSFIRCFALFKSFKLWVVF